MEVSDVNRKYIPEDFSETDEDFAFIPIGRYARMAMDNDARRAPRAHRNDDGTERHFQKRKPKRVRVRDYL